MLQKTYRLKRRQDFRRVYQRGKSSANRVFVLCWRPNRNGVPRIGFSVSKKIGKAVERNRVRRKLREACRLEFDFFAPGYDYVIIARGAAKTTEVTAMRYRIREVLKQISLSPRPGIGIITPKAPITPETRKAHKDGAEPDISPDISSK